LERGVGRAGSRHKSPTARNLVAELRLSFLESLGLVVAHLDPWKRLVMLTKGSESIMMI
jgi:hypothetical protein